MRLLLIRLLLILVLIVCAVLLVPIKSNGINHLIILPFEKRISKEIKFESSRIWLPGSVILRGVSVLGKGEKLASVKDVRVDYNLAGIFTQNGAISFEARGVLLPQDIKLLDTVSAMLTIPNVPAIQFECIKGVLNFQKDTVYVKNIDVRTSDMKIQGEGRISRQGELNCKLHFSFSGAIINDAPDIIKTTLLTEEADGWMGITLNAEGNYAKPYLSIDSETFKLNIQQGILCR